MASVWRELKRRNVVRVALAYAIVSWLLIEISSVLGPALHLPEWSTTLVVFLLILAFPVALILSWAYEMTPEGIKREKDVDRSQSITGMTGRKLDYFIIGALAVALVFVVVDQYVLEESAAPELASGSDESATALATANRPDVLPNSVAVLPFANLSPDPNNAYFAAGIHEELLNQLVKIRDLSVIARTSVLQYEGAERPIEEIAKELRVEAVMEGSVRYADGAVRITAQLNDGVTGTHLWSETYTREFKDIFQIETDIATAIAEALEAELTIDERERIEAIPTDSVESYSYYLRASDTGRILAIGDAEIETATAFLDQAIEIDHEFASAYALRAKYAWMLMRRVSESRRIELEERARQDLARAMELDSNLGIAYHIRALLHQSNWQRKEASGAYTRAYALIPNDTNLAGDYARFMAFTGRPEEAIRLAERAHELEPDQAVYYHFLGIVHSFAGNDDAAYAAFQNAAKFREDPYTNIELAWLELRRGNRDHSIQRVNTAERLMKTLPGYGVGGLALLAYSYGLAGAPDDAARLAQTVLDDAGEEVLGSANMVFANLAIGDLEEALRHLSSAPGRWAFLSRGQISIKNNVYQDPILDRPEFVAAREKLGYQD